MNIMSNGSFLDEMNASNKQEALVKSLTSAWEKKNSKVARAGGVSLMALSLAACGGSDDTPFSQADIDTALTDTSGTQHATVDAAITSNDATIAAGVDITTDNQAAIDEAVAAVDLTTDNAGAVTTALRDAAATLDVSGTSTMTNAELITAIKTANDATIAAGVDITTDNQAAIDEAVAAVDLTTDNQAAIDEAVAAVDLTTDNAAAVTTALRDAAATLDVSGTSTMTNAELITAIKTANDATIAAGVDITTDNQAAIDEAVAAVDLTTDNAAAVTAGLKAAADDLGVTGTASMTDAQLVEAIKTANDTAVANAVDVTTDNASATDTAVAAATSFASLDALVAAYDALANPAASGLVLTSKADDVANGDANDNTITGTQATFDDTDTIKGGDGTDTLAITNTASGTYAPAFMTSVEKIQMTSFANSSIDLVSSTGVTDVISLNSTAKNTFSNVQTLADIGVNGSSGDVKVTYKDSLMSGTTDEVNLALSGGADVGDVVIQGATATNVVETVNITASGTSAVAVDSILSNSAAIGTLDISGATDLTLGTGTAFDSGDILAVNIDASDMTGDLTVYADGANTNASITGGAGADTIYLDGVKTFFAADNGNAASNVVTSIVGGDGDDTLVIDGSLVASQLVTSTADTADNVLSGVENVKLVLTGGASTDLGGEVDASISSDVESIVAEVTNADVTDDATNTTVTATISNIKAQTVSVTGTASAKDLDSKVALSLTKYDGSSESDSQSVTLAGAFKTVTFNDASDDSDTSATDESGAVEAVSVTSGASDVVVDSLAATKAFDVTLDGAKDVTIAAANLGATDTTDTETANDLVTVNAADLTGDLDFTKSEAGVYSIKGGSGTNDVRLGAKGADTTVTGGAGTDTVYLSDTAGTDVADIAITTTGVEAIEITTISSGDDDFDLTNVSSSTVVKLVDGAGDKGFGVTLSEVGSQVIDVVTADGTTDTAWATAAVISAAKAEGATNTTIKLSGDAAASATASSYDGVIASTGKVTVDSQIQTSAGVYLDTNVELKGAITELVLTGGGAQSDTTVANVDIKDASSAPVALASLDATAFTGDITATTAGVFASAATVALSTGDTSLTLATDQLARDASTITDAGGDDTLVFTAAAQGNTGTLSLRPDMTGVETISVKTTATSSHADGVVALNLVDTSGVTTIKTDGVGANDVTISNAGAVTSLVMGGGTDTVADDVSLDAATALTVENSAIVGNTNAGKLTVDGATSLVLEHGHASAINFTTLSADAATLIEIGGGLDGAGTTATEIVTLEADEVASLNLDASDGSVLVDNITADKLTKITISGDNAVTLGEDSSGNAGAVSTVKLAAVSGASATGAITLSGNMEYAANASVVTGTAADSVDLTSSVAAGVTVSTGAGDDTITTDSAALRAVDGGADADDGDATTYDGGNDTLVLTGTNNAGTGVVNLAATGDQVTTFNGVAEAVVQKGFESIDLSGLTSSGSFGFGITAAATGSTIVGSGANDTITGGAVADTITGGAGNDTINLGSDSAIDTVVFSASSNGADTVTGFKAGSGGDLIDVTGYLTTFATANVNAVAAVDSDDVMENDHVFVVDFDGDIASKAIEGADFGDLFHADDKYLLTTKGDLEAVVIVQGDDQTELFYITNDNAAAIDAGDVTLIATLSDLTNSDTLTADNFVAA